MGHLNVNPADLFRAADDYTELAARTAQLPAQALAEIQRIAASHGPMGFPTALGIAAGMAARESAVQAKAAQFEQYAHTFTGHAAAYIDQDRAAAATFDALTFPQAHIDPKPPPDQPVPPPVVCWLPSPGADPAKYCPAETTRIEYVDDKAQWIQKDIGTGANEVVINGELPAWSTCPAHRRGRPHPAPPIASGPTSTATSCTNTTNQPAARPRSKCCRRAGSVGRPTVIRANKRQRSRLTATSRYKGNEGTCAAHVGGEQRRGAARSPRSDNTSGRLAVTTGRRPR